MYRPYAMRSYWIRRISYRGWEVLGERERKREKMSALAAVCVCVLPVNDRCVLSVVVHFVAPALYRTLFLRFLVPRFAGSFTPIL